jgi:anthranilate synthase component 1
MHHPDFAAFAELARTHTVVPVYRRLVADALTPVSAFAAVRRPGACFLFESVVGGERVGRYSFVGAGPVARFAARGHAVRIDGTAADHPDPLKALEDWLAGLRGPHLPDLPRFTGGAVGYAGYDAVRYIERLPNPPPDDRRLPDLDFALYDRMCVFDHITKTVLAVAHWRADSGQRTADRAEYDAACQRVDELVEALARPPALPPTDIHPAGEVDRSRYASNFTPDAWHAMVRRGIEYIRAGDVFQFVPSQRFRTTTTADSFAVYRALRVVNPSPFMFHLETPACTLVGASPEILCRVEGGEMTVRPLAGTRRRGRTPAEDRQLEAELLADPKERAEHIMLVDLGRNDVGRVAERGSVRLSDLMTVERYSHVMHISSTVTGKLQAGRTAFDALRAALPAGTLSGAPKVRAMEVIDELEPHRRGPYGGAVGYIDFAGDMDTCIALRTLVQVGHTLDIQAGCGVVADSDPQAEFDETVNKAMGLMRAVEVAERQLS